MTRDEVYAIARKRVLRRVARHGISPNNISSRFLDELTWYEMERVEVQYPPHQPRRESWE